MTEGQMKCFMAVIENQSFSKAAGQLYVSQPSVSKSISTLENELGMSLIERQGTTLSPTPAGKILYHFLEGAFAEYDEVLEQMKATLTAPRGVFRIGCPETWNPACFFEKIKSLFDEKYPQITVELVSDRLPALFTNLQSGKVDIILTHEFYPQLPYGYSVKKLTETGCGVVFAKDFYSGIDSPEKLDGEQFLIYDNEIEKKFTEKMKQVCAQHGFNPVIRNCGSFSRTLFIMSCGDGFMFFTDWDIPVTNTSNAYLPLNYRSKVNIVYQTGTNSDIIRDLVEAFK